MLISLQANANEILLIAFIVFIISLILLNQAETINHQTRDILDKWHEESGEEEDEGEDCEPLCEVDCFICGRDK